jgi:hypothetical protein
MEGSPHVIECLRSSDGLACSAIITEEATGIPCNRCRLTSFCLLLVSALKRACVSGLDPLEE